MSHTVKIPTTKWPVPVLLLVVLLLMLGGCGGGGTSSSGQEETTSTSATTTNSKETTSAGLASRNVTLTPSRDSEVSGTASFTDEPNGGVRVELSMQNLPQIEQPGTQHLAHIHEGGTCADDRADNGAPVAYPLNTVVTQPDWTGVSTTTLSNVSVDTLFSGSPKYINVHAVGETNETPPGISCADLVAPVGGSTSGGGSTTSTSSSS